MPVPMRRSQVERDVVPFSHKLFGWIRRKEPSFLSAVGIAYLACPVFPLFTLIGTAVAVALARDRVIDHPEGPFWRPVAGGDKKLTWTRMEGPPDKGGKGVWCMGNAMDTKEEIWVTDDTIRAHMALFGTTGGGKTVALEGQICQAIGHGSGVIMVDGKSDPKTWFDIVTMAKMYGREDDLLVLNFISSTGFEKLAILDEDDADTAKEKLDLLGKIHSNTFNPFTYGSADTLTELVTGLMRPEGGGDGMWRGRAEAMIRSLMRGLVAMREAGKVTLSVQVLRDYMNLDKIGYLEADEGIPSYAREQLKSYLDELPGYRDAIKVKETDPAAFGQYWEQATKQHGFLTMQFTELLGLLSGTYGHICNVEWGDVDFQDVVYNRRILYVMLPALEKAPSSLANLGRLTVAGIKNALSVSLKGQLTGTKKDIVDSRPTNSDTALLAIMDEYGSYAVEGFGDVAAQARSLGVSVIFAGQDFPSFKKGSEIEASRILANTGVKVFLKTEDQETADIAIKRAGEGVYAWAGGKRLSEHSDKMVDTGDANYREESRLTYLDLVDLAEGQAWFMNRNHLIKMNTFYVQLDGKVVQEAKHNTLFPLGTDLARAATAARIMQDVVGIPERNEAGEKTVRLKRRGFIDVDLLFKVAEQQEVPLTLDDMDEGDGEADGSGGSPPAKGSMPATPARPVVSKPAPAAVTIAEQIDILNAEHNLASQVTTVANTISDILGDVPAADKVAEREESAMANLSMADLSSFVDSLIDQASQEKEGNVEDGDTDEEGDQSGDESGSGKTGSSSGGGMSLTPDTQQGTSLPLTGFSAAAFFGVTGGGGDVGGALRETESETAPAAGNEDILSIDALFNFGHNSGGIAVAAAHDEQASEEEGGGEGDSARGAVASDGGMQLAPTLADPGVDQDEEVLMGEVARVSDTISDVLSKAADDDDSLDEVDEAAGQVIKSDRGNDFLNSLIMEVAREAGL
ncbi:TraM recognition domain-containing protein [Vogesella sp. XCS3]|uniref:TraM recognition domain-containing protein n=1 Tax=Vogesella sp. XCS3 TaxID=2877939 RepID=UPI001D0B0BD8|nr:TraM recognition domain-containing protein [Vogesella sp. XCS3]UDM18848.1 TraM recognition domain-containing protein [Vogesella sp. XCS3]